MNIDWDSLVHDAENSPQSLLLNAADLAENMDFVIIVAKTKDEEVHTWLVGGSYLERIGAIHMAAEAIHDEAVGLAPESD